MPTKKIKESLQNKIWARNHLFLESGKISELQFHHLNW